MKKMNILFISRDLIAGNIARLLAAEGHHIKLYIAEEKKREGLEGIVEKTNDWRAELPWVGKDGLIIFDDSGMGATQDELRKEGYAVVGGCKEADHLEYSREYAQSIFQEYGLKTVPLRDFSDISAAYEFARENPRPWVIKRNDKDTKVISYISEFDDGRDVINLLKSYSEVPELQSKKVSLQERVQGVEIGVGRYFNGKNWVGPIELNIEHTHLFPGSLGPLTDEMGTIAWYSDNENNKLFQETLAKLLPYLRKIGFRGDMELNCMVNETGAYILEPTPRFGSPIVHLHSELHKSPWGEFLSALARGKDYKLKWKEGYGIVVCIFVPPFPYSIDNHKEVYRGIKIHFDNLSRKEMQHVHFEEVMLRNKEYCISEGNGYLLYVTAVESSVKEAQKEAYSIADRIILPRKFYRNDIGTAFAMRDIHKLRKWGYMDEPHKSGWNPFDLFKSEKDEVPLKKSAE